MHVRLTTGRATGKQAPEKQLNEQGNFQSKLVPGLWSHKTRPITFTLIIDDFGVKYGPCSKNIIKSRPIGQGADTLAST